MDKHYNPKIIEKKCYQNWEQNNNFAASDTSDKPPYCIMIPPPNITGTLHMGHAFQDTVMDSLIRYHRMQGKNTLWQPGADHAGIATQIVVERQLESEGKTKHDLGREQFIDKVWQWKNQSGGTINQQFRRMGCSLDWARERFTMDEGLSDAVKQVFVKLYQEGLIYRGKRLVNWDPILHTALSDLEVVAQEEDGKMYYVRYPFANETGFMQIATTRPETILADGALAVNPNDDRFKHLVGKIVKVPMTTREIPIIADDYVEPEFGTGCVKITPAHDFNDWQVGQRNEMAVINLFTKSATMNENAPKAYQGMDRFVARKQIIKDLDQAGLLVKVEPHKLKLPRGDRTNAIVEPYLTDQWYVKMQPLAKPALKAVQDGTIKFVPDNWKNTYYHWLEDIQDWCISRQIWWGHQIPAWFDDAGEVYVAASELDVRQQYKLADEVNLTQETDVLDTWFSSALWPFSTLGWPENTKALETFYPTSVLVTGFDIIFFWVARMIMFGLKFMGTVPFKEVYIHGLVKDSHGQKMSKSKGNVLDPIDLIDGIDLDSLITKRTSGLMLPKMRDNIIKQTKLDYKDGIAAFGTDALRFTLASLATTGRDINFALKRIEGYRNFCNKIWNASRFVLLQTEDQTLANPSSNLDYSVIDLWIQAKLSVVIDEVEAAMTNYRLDLATQAIYEFIWSDYCDWYLELCKVTLNNDSASDKIKQITRYNLLMVLEQTLRLIHPIMPYLSEDIWLRISSLLELNGDTIMLQPYPKSSAIDSAALEQITWLQKFIYGIRQIRGEMNIAPNTKVTVLLQNLPNQKLLAKLENYLLQVGKIASITVVDNDTQLPEVAVALVDEMKILIPLTGLINKQDEIARIAKEIVNISSEINRLEDKLANKNFVAKAPTAIVNKELAKLQILQTNLTNLTAQKLL